MAEFFYSESIEVNSSPEFLYDMLTDIERTGEWSPVCRACWWQDGGRLQEGAWFIGRNEADGMVWETDSQVEVASPGREFTWLVGGKYARWSFQFAKSGLGTTLTESWEFLPAGRDMFADKYGPDARRWIELRSAQARTSIPATLAAVKRLAESVGI